MLDQQSCVARPFSGYSVILHVKDRQRKLSGLLNCKVSHEILRKEIKSAIEGVNVFL